MAKQAAASGCRTGQRRTQPMPLMVAVRRSWSLSRSRVPRFQPMLPPICNAAPSRPAEPPHRWVSTVPRKIAGTSRMLTGSPLCTARRTLLVPHALALCYLIKGSDEQTRHRQKEQQPRLRGAQLGGVLDGKVEQGAQKSTEQTHGNRQKEPLQRHPQGGFSFVPECIKIVHRHNSCILTSVPLFLEPI